MTEITGVGQELAAAREARGLALADIAQQLKFASRQLEALEQEQFEALPGAAFTRGMVRSYARLLKLDPEPLVQRVAGRCEAPDASRLAARYEQAVPFSDTARRSSLIYVAVSFGVLLLVGGVAYQWHEEHTAPATRVTVLASAQPASPEPTVRAAAAAVAAPAQVEPPAPVRPVVQEEIIAAEKTVPAAPPAARVAGNRLVVRTEGEAWIEIKDSADRMLVSSLNPAGSERVVHGKPPYSLVIGNASQVSVIYGNKPVDLSKHTRDDVARFKLP
ncbi:MAG TPA: RodZ domain-containing protein [Burkholderiales bacterium]|nr:RodZ domain-containing protein [Burkholderiales bacterium]